MLCLQGLVKNIGVSNFSIAKLRELLSFCRVRPAVNQVRLPLLPLEMVLSWRHCDTGSASSP